MIFILGVKSLGAGSDGSITQRKLSSDRNKPTGSMLGDQMNIKDLRSWWDGQDNEGSISN